MSEKNDEQNEDNCRRISDCKKIVQCPDKSAFVVDCIGCEFADFSEFFIFF